MNLLLDTHTFLWFIAGSSNLSKKARTLIEDADNQIFLSSASLWEIAIKISLGKLKLVDSFETFIPQQLEVNGIEMLNIAISHTAVVAQLPFHHRDPFDRLLIAQAVAEEMPIVSGDEEFDKYEITRLW